MGRSEVDPRTGWRAQLRHRVQLFRMRQIRLETVTELDAIGSVAKARAKNQQNATAQWLSNRYFQMKR